MARKGMSLPKGKNQPNRMPTTIPTRGSVTVKQIGQRAPGAKKDLGEAFDDGMKMADKMLNDAGQPKARTVTHDGTDMGNPSGS